MASVTETELKQKTSEFIHFVRDFALNADKDVRVSDKRDGYQLTIIEKDVVLDFSL